jgi:acetyl-CoA carboxylase carboxyltransferase component
VRAHVDAIELLDTDGDPGDAVGDALPADRCTISCGDTHRTWRIREGVAVEATDLHGLHPEAAARVDLARLAAFDLERLPGADDVYCFWARSREIADDERIVVLADVRGRHRGVAAQIAAFERAFHQATSLVRTVRSTRDPARRLQWNRIALFVAPEVALAPDAVDALARRLASATRYLGLERVIVRLRLRDPAHSGATAPVELVISDVTGARMEIVTREPVHAPLAPASAYERKVVAARRRRLLYPYEIVRMLGGTFAEYDLAPDATRPRAVPVERPHGGNTSAVVFGIVSTPTDKLPDGMRRVLVLSDPTRGMGALAAPECDRVEAAIDLAERLGLPVEWAPISAGARIAMDSGTENLDATARVARRIVTFTQGGGVIHVVVHGVNVGAQSYWNALATMQGHTRGVLVMTPGAAMVLTGRAALEASGSVSADDEVALGGLERVMGPNGEAQYYAGDIGAAFGILAEHQRYAYVVPGEAGPRPHRTADPTDRDVTAFPYPADLDHGFRTVGEVFDDRTNPGRKRPFAMRVVMQALVDQDGGSLERWRGWIGAETAIVWDAHLGGRSVCLVGIESQSVEREGYHPHDGPSSWTGGTLFPLSSKKVARALNAASGVRPVVILANLSGFDGSAESLRKLQLEYGAEIARAVVNLAGPICFLVVSRYHGGAYVVFSKSLNPRMRAAALTGSYASVIGGGPAAAVVFTREVRVRAGKHPDVQRLRDVLRARPTPAAREAVERAMGDAVLAAQAELAAEFDAIHSVERARAVGSLDDIVEPRAMRPYLIETLDRAR